MQLLCLNDRGGWGAQLGQAAAARGYAWRLFSAGESLPRPVPDQYVFMRLAQEADRLHGEKQFMSLLHDEGYQIIPDYFTCMAYEDKAFQARLYPSYMPKTYICTTAAQAYEALSKLKYPFISKSKTGSASRNVRIIPSEIFARHEIQHAFSTEGLTAPHKMGELHQRGYLLWQEFLGDNAYDYRVVAVGTKRMILQRFNKPGTPFASGSGQNSPAPFSAEVHSVLFAAEKFFQENHIGWCGIDMVCDKETMQWKVLETTLGWSAKAYNDCQFYGTRWYGRHIWEVLLNEIEAGVFK